MSPGEKRKADHVDGRDGAKRQKVAPSPTLRLEAASTDAEQQKKQWRVTRKNDNHEAHARAIQPGDSGIWATCVKGKESKAVGELRDLFAEYEELLYGDVNGRESQQGGAGKAEAGIEDDIDAELAELSRPSKAQLFTPIRLDLQCGQWLMRTSPFRRRQLAKFVSTVVFFRTIAPVDPVALVKKICQDAMDEPLRKRTRFVKRLSPMTLMGRASEEGLEKVAREVLAPDFHQQPLQPRKVSRPRHRPQRGGCVFGERWRVIDDAMAAFD